MTHGAIDDDRLAVDHEDRKSLTYLSDALAQRDVEHERLSRQSGLAAESNPLVIASLLNDHVRE